MQSCDGWEEMNTAVTVVIHDSIEHEYEGETTVTKTIHDYY